MLCVKTEKKTLFIALVTLTHNDNVDSIREFTYLKHDFPYFRLFLTTEASKPNEQ